MLVRISSWPFKGRKKEKRKEGNRYWLHRTKDVVSAGTQALGRATGNWGGSCCGLWYPLWRDPPGLCPSHWTSGRCFLGKLATAASQRKPSSPCLSHQPWTCVNSQRGHVTAERDVGCREKALETWRCEAIEGPPPSKQHVMAQPCRHLESQP